MSQRVPTNATFEIQPDIPPLIKMLSNNLLVYRFCVAMIEEGTSTAYNVCTEEQIAEIKSLIQRHKELQPFL